MMNSRHVAIAGAGLVGRLLAWRLARQGLRVTLFDSRGRDDTRSASAVAAAMLSPLAELAVADATVLSLAQEAMALWPQWLAELQHDSGREVYYRREGTLVVAHAADAGSLTQFERVLRHKLPAEQVSSLQALDAHGVAQAEPALAGRFSQGLMLQGEGQLANDELMLALAVALERAGVDWRDGVCVRSLGEHQLHTHHGVHDADVVVDARGAGARADWPGLRGVRGEVLTVACDGVTLRRPVRLMHPRYQLYVAPRPRGRFVVGATELESEDDGPMALRSMLELGSALYSLHPAFAEARVLHLGAALRPTFDDHHAALRQHGGVWQINGLYRHGYLCAPALVQALVGRLLP